MKSIIELNMNISAEQKALRAVIQKVAIGKVVTTIKQAVKKDNDYVFKTIQSAVTEMGALISMNGNYIYISIRDLKRHNVKQVQTMWKTVLKRGINQYIKGEANDYFMTIDCVTIDKEQSKIFSFGSLETPVFCSSDGDDDLTLAVPFDKCYISIDNYNAREIAYEATKGIEQGEKVIPLTKQEYKQETPEIKKKTQSEEYTNLMKKINNGIDIEGTESE